MGQELSPSSHILRQMLIDRGYPQDLCEVICHELNTDFTASRMIGYLAHYQQLHAEDVVDEMLAILSDRQRWVDKKIMEDTQQKWNVLMASDIWAEDE